MQRVEDSEQVGEGQVDGSPGKQSEAPRHSKQEGEADDAPEVSKNLDHSEGYFIMQRFFGLRGFVLHFMTKSSGVFRKLMADLLSEGAVAAFAIAAADLHHHHDEHGHVEQEHQAEVTHTGGVEDALLLDPTPERKQTSAESLVAVVIPDRLFTKTPG